MTSNKQKGFSLLEVSIATVLASIGIVAAVQMRAAQVQADALRGVAQVYERLNNAAGSYMTVYYDQLLGKGQPQCGVVPYQVGGSAGAPRISARINCALELTNPSGKKWTVANYLQPTPKDLFELGLLSEPQDPNNEVLPLQTYAANNGDSSLITVNADGVRAPNGFAILIQLMCIGDTSVKEPVTSAGVCVGGPFDLRSLVFNLQPYEVAGTTLYQLINAAGSGRTYVSDTQFKGKLVAGGEVLDNQLTNPLNQAPGTVGAPYIVAMRNGYGSAGYDAFVRRDGSTPLTGSWNVGGKDITGIAALGAGSVTTGTLSATDSVTTANLTATNAVTTGTLTATTVATQTLSSNSGIFGGLVDAFSAALKTTTAYVKDALDVAGTFSVSGVATLSGSSTKVSNLRLENEAELGDSCSPSTETLRRSKTTTGSLLLLVCDPGTSKWARAQKDYGSDISTINTNVGSVSSAVNTVSSGLSKLENEYMNWDIININWEKATLQDDNRWLAKDYVWKRTPWKCNDLNGGAEGGLPVWDKENGIRWAKNASEFQKAVQGGAYTPPIFVGFDDVVNDNIVYDINCEPYSGDNNTKYWYVGVSAKKDNEKGGNVCRSGLGSSLTESTKTMYTYKGDAATCKNFNILAPNFAPQALAARFIAFTKK